MGNNIELFFQAGRNKKEFPEVLAEIQEYVASKYSTLITDNPEEQRQQITSYIASIWPITAWAWRGWTAAS